MSINFSSSMVPELRRSFFEFLSLIKIDSKEGGGQTKLEPYTAQRIALNAIFNGLEEDKHDHTFLKARQLGITTVMLVLDIFWLSIFEGIQGAIIFDTEENREQFRTQIDRMLESLPPTHRIPLVKNNRNGLVLQNGSSAGYLVAGKRKNAQLGRGRGLNFVHATECAFWGDPVAVETLRKALAQKFPARLFIFESTANGMNLFYEMWQDAIKDDLRKTATFIGWWAKEDYDVSNDEQMMARYGQLPPNSEEQEKIDIVKTNYDVTISMGQLAWYRHERDPESEGDESDYDVPSDSIIDQEYPWHEDEAFIVTGSAFFGAKDVVMAYKKAEKHLYRGFRYSFGEDFFATTVEQVRTARHTQLKIWEDPVEGSTYVIGADPSYGSSPQSDAYVIQVLRCWANGWKQVAEFREVNCKTWQFAWVILHVCGVYKNARLLMEINGPGEAVLTEYRHIQNLAETGQLVDATGKQGVFNFFGHIRNYLFHRADSLGGGYSWHWKTTGGNKMVILNQLKDAWTLGKAEIISVATLGEMKTLAQEGDVIKGEGKAKDDLVIALALANRAYIDGERGRLIARQWTKELEEKSLVGTKEDMQTQFSRGIVENFFATKAKERAALARQARTSYRRR